MKILLIGASGKTGQWVARLASQQGHQVTALVQSQLNDPGRELDHVILGSASDVAALRRAVHGQHAVISCFGQRSAADANLLTQSAKAVVEALQERPPKRYVHCGPWNLSSIARSWARQERPSSP